MKQDPIKQFFLDANPNPAREGCPSPDVLRAIASNALPPNDPARLHLAGCSPCFNEFLTFKEQHKHIDQATVEEEHFSDEDFRDFHRLVQQAALQAYPNPERDGCPGTAVLDAVARTPAPFKHPAYQHVKRCSPCLQEMLTLRQQSLSAKKPTAKRKLAYGAIAAAALIGIGIGMWATKFTESNHNSKISSPKQNTTADTTPQQYQPTPSNLYAISLVGISRTRGSASADETKPITIPGRLLTLQITLPFGSDDGKYDIEIRQPGISKPLVKTSGLAHIKEGDTLLNIPDFDLTNLPHGAYDLFFKHADASWQRGPILID